MSELVAVRVVDVPALTEWHNEYTSVSRLKMFSGCPKSFEFKYVIGAKKDPSEADFFDFGKLHHAAVESTLRWVVANEYQGPYPTAELLQAFRLEWRKYDLKESMYEESLDLLRRYARQQPDIDAIDILGIEQEIDVDLGDGVRLKGFIDLVERDGDSGVLVTDHKTNRMLFTREEIESDLQATAYMAICRQLYPWATSIRFAFSMLRFGGQRHYTSRTPQQLDDAIAHIIDSTKRTEQRSAYKAKVGNQCTYCDYKSQCNDYQDFMAAKPPRMPMPAQMSIGETIDLYQECHSKANSFYSKKKQCSDALKEHLDRYGEAASDKYVANLTEIKGSTYPVQETVRLLQKYTGAPIETIMARLFELDNKKLEAFLEEQSAGVRGILSLELDAIKTVRVEQTKLNIRVKK